MSKKVIVGIGEILWDMLPSGKALGGAPANFAYHAKRLGMEALAVSAIGHDALGEELVDTLEAHALPYHLDRVDHPTGTVQVTLDALGLQSYTIMAPVSLQRPLIRDSVGIRTQDPQLRRLLLYPAELRNHPIQGCKDNEKSAKGKPYQRSDRESSSWSC